VRGLHHAAAEGLRRLRFHRHHLQGLHPPEARIGSDESWDKAEHAADGSLRRSGCEFEICRATAPSTVPKIEYTLKDAMGRQWQCGTMQVDFSTCPSGWMPSMWAKTAARHRPVMLHRAIVGSLERFIGILIEQHAGALPVWLAPVQVAVLNITDAQADYCRKWQNAAKSRA
jgi:threonyl-tRNA synthetase